jgi:hypothetical protein
MRPVCVFTDVPACARVQIMDLLHGRWRTATRLIMVVLSAAGMSPAEIADLLDYQPATVRRWLHRYSVDGIGGLPDRPRPGRPRRGGPALTSRITALLKHPGRGRSGGSGNTWADPRSACVPCGDVPGRWPAGDDPD